MTDTKIVVDSCVCKAGNEVSFTYVYNDVSHPYTVDVRGTLEKLITTIGNKQFIQILVIKKNFCMIGQTQLFEVDSIVRGTFGRVSDK